MLAELRGYGRRLIVNSTRYEGDGVDDKLLKLCYDTGGLLLTTLQRKSRRCKTCGRSTSVS